MNCTLEKILHNTMDAGEWTCHTFTTSPVQVTDIQAGLDFAIVIYEATISMPNKPSIHTRSDHLS
jgi:hypothetical protein